MSYSTSSFEEFDHAPDANLDYGFVWTLDTGETITNSSWAATTGITLSNLQVNVTTTSVFAAGGTIGQLYQLTNTIVTSLGKTDSRTITLSCKRR